MCSNIASRVEWTYIKFTEVRWSNIHENFGTQLAVAWMHRWIGRMVVIHSVLHGTIAILSDGQPVQTIRQHYISVLVRYQHRFREGSECNSPNTDHPSNQE